jgi:hypothetical protein
MSPNVSAASAIPTETSESINARILAVSEDRIAGFVEEPFAAIAAAAELEEGVVIERLQAMLSAGVVRRIRQTLMATNLAPGASQRTGSTLPSTTWWGTTHFPDTL